MNKKSFELRIPGRLLDMKLSPTARNLWAYLNYRQGKNADCWPSVKTMATDLTSTRKTIYKALAQLKAVNEIRITVKAHGGPGLTNHYAMSYKSIDVPIRPAQKVCANAHTFDAFTYNDEKYMEIITTTEQPVVVEENGTNQQPGETGASHEFPGNGTKRETVNENDNGGERLTKTITATDGEKRLPGNSWEGGSAAGGLNTGQKAPAKPAVKPAVQAARPAAAGAGVAGGLMRAFRRRSPMNQATEAQVLNTLADYPESSIMKAIGTCNGGTIAWRAVEKALERGGRSLQAIAAEEQSREQERQARHDVLKQQISQALPAAVLQERFRAQAASLGLSSRRLS